MNREIKFRAWCPHNEEMYTDDNSPEYTFYINQGTISFIPNNGFDDFNSFYTGIEDDVENGFLKIIPMQFTGLKDKNGVEIYEGDIIKSPDEDFNYCLCEWNDKNACFQINGYGKSMYLNENSGEEFSEDIKLIEEHILVLGGDNEIEVIGNVHQNPELL